MSNPRLNVPSLRFILLLLFVALNTQSSFARSSKPVALGPKEVALTFFKAVQTGDMVKAHSLAIGTEIQFAMIQSILRIEPAMKKFKAAVIKNYGGEMDEAFKSGILKSLDVSPLSQLLALVRSQNVKISGSTATLGTAGKTMKFQKVGNSWKLNLDFLGNDAKNVACFEGVLVAWQVMTQGVEMHKYESLSVITASISEGVRLGALNSQRMKSQPRHNPILGKWGEKNGGGMIQYADMEFTEKEEIVRGIRYPTRYLINGKTVIVIPAGMIPHTCIVIDDHTIKNRINAYGFPVEVLLTRKSPAKPALPLISVDFNRDGLLEFQDNDKTSAAQPYRFWLNDDRDVDVREENDQEDIAPPVRPSDRDCSDSVISTERDLEDFSRLQIEAPSGFTPDATWRCTVNFINSAAPPSIRLWRAVSSGRQYLIDTWQAKKQCEVSGRDSWPVGKSEKEIPISLFGADYGHQFHANLLFEGVHPGKGALQVHFYKQGKEQASKDPVWLELRPIRDFYDYYLLPTVNLNGSPTNYSTTTAAKDVAASQSSDYILFVHGWRMREWEKRSFAETAFKRLWQRGYKGKFGLFSWPTEYTPLVDYPVAGLVPEDLQCYDRSERIAWRSADKLHKLLASLNGQFPQKVRVVAHSMGNVVTSEALLLEAESQSPKKIVHTYIATQAATPAQAYDASVENDRSVFHYLKNYTDSDPNVYRNYPLTSRPYFEGTRGNKGIAAAAGRLVNYFNAQDSALSGWITDQGTKPDTGYGYGQMFRITLPVATETSFYRGQLDDKVLNGQVLNFPADRYEIFAHAAPAFSAALGTQAVGGPFSKNVDLEKEFRYSDERSDHSAQFNSTLMARYSYWDSLMKDFGIDSASDSLLTTR